ncbi:lysophospholipid acyltransferase family protein [Natribacillus halophilus]|uniref:1-acyl-sn-glycerol-3-phosphate acyltransferase n=1 Tax=Natribacillus halophilus TaxID=549003 RepID=A0A1G8JDG6_9BACI|nr:lysophospholipid acyltransferase family protein [Natribacillus halophilus]SDI29314.1 1-acyl-sn-glycerol-3-phosphate acyltransferase [Natribacillus halophilus]
MIYKIGKLISRIVLSLVFFAKIEGKENIPVDGPVIICSNHRSYFDPPLLGSYIKRPLRFMAKEELFTSKWFGPLIQKLGAFPVKRGGSDRGALRKGINVLANGEMLLLFPEGTRSETGEIREGLTGVGFFALKSEATVIPAYIQGKYKPFRRVALRYGSPISLEGLRKNQASSREVTDHIMSHIQKLKDEAQKPKNR